MNSPPTLRAPDRRELGAFHELIASIEVGGNQPYLTALGEAEEFFDDPINPYEDNLRVLELDDRLIGWGHITHSPSGQKLERAFLHGGVAPDHKRQGHGGLIMAWLNERAAERMAETPHHLEAIAIIEAYSWQDDNAVLYADFGFEPARYFDELQRSVTGDLPPVETPNGIRIERWADSFHEQARQVYNSAFLDHWGTTPRSERAWAADVIDSFARRLDLSFAAFDGADMVAYSLNAHFPDDVKITGREDGWVDSICTLSTHRGRGIASALLTHSLNAFAQAGLTSSMLGVDSDNPTGAYGIYERLGYRPLQRGISYMRTIRQGAEPVKMY